MIRDPDLVKTVLVRDYASFSTNDFPVDAEGDPLLIYNPFVVDGDRWRKSRQLLSPLYTTSRMRQLFPVMERICDQLVEYVERHEGQDLEAKSVRLEVVLALEKLSSKFVYFSRSRPPLRHKMWPGVPSVWTPIASGIPIANGV